MKIDEYFEDINKNRNDESGTFFNDDNDIKIIGIETKKSFSFYTNTDKDPNDLQDGKETLNLTVEKNVSKNAKLYDIHDRFKHPKYTRHQENQNN